MQIADVYLFEDREASTISAEKHFTYSLEDCDVCIFLIDNKEGIPNGVLKEIETANKHGIKSIYYFCKEKRKSETPFQKSIKNHNFAVSKTVNSFEELLSRPAIALLDDFIQIYKHYCKGRLIFSDDNNSSEKVVPDIDRDLITTPLNSKNVFSNIDNCKNYFSKLILQQPIDIINSGKLDAYCSNFLPVILDNKSVLSFNKNQLLKEIKRLHSSDEYYTVVEKRWSAIYAYYQGDISNCIASIHLALNDAKAFSLPEWVIQDLLIDLRNITNTHGECQGSLYKGDTVQKELDEHNGVFHYPLLDRFNSNLYEKCIQDDIKEKTKSPHTITLGNDLSSYINLLASKFVVAISNGSITQLLMLYNHIKDVSFVLTSRFSDWNLRLLLLKTTVINGRSADIDGIIRRYDDILCKMNAKDSKSVYEFSCSRPIEFQRFISNLEAFRVVGYFLDDNDFSDIWNSISERINEWLLSDKSNMFVGQHIFPALSDNILRLEANEIADICCRLIDKKYVRFYDDMFRMLATPIDMMALSSSMITKVNDSIVSVIAEGNDNNLTYAFKKAICVLRKKYRHIVDPIDDAVKQYMPLFYAKEYLLDSLDDDDNKNKIFLQGYIEVAKKRNEEQGKNGIMHGYGNDPYYTIRCLIENSKVVFSKKLLDSAFNTAAESLFNTAYSISEKSSAMKLLIFLAQKYQDIVKRNKSVVLKINKNEELVVSGSGALSNLSNMSLRLSALFMRYCFGESVWKDLMEVLADIKDDEPSLIHASGVVSHFLEHQEVKEIDTEFVTILLQYLLLWCREENVDIRWNAISGLLHLVIDERCKSIVCNQLVRAFDTDNVYIKNRISWHINVIKDIDRPSYDYIIQKASIDTNYVVRKRYSMLAVEKSDEVTA